MTENIRFISENGLEELGKGAEGTAYALDENKILKVYKTKDFGQIEGWFRNICVVDNCGIRCAKAFELVKTENGFGIVFERLSGKNLGWTIHENPEKIDSYAVKMGKFLKTINTTIDNTGTFECVTDRMMTCLMTLEKRGLIDDKRQQEVRTFFESIERRNTLIHSDYHEGNILVDSNDELVLIDLDRVGVGHPIYDLIGNYLNHEAMLLKNPDFALKSWGLDSESIKHIKRIMLETYYGTSDKNLLTNYTEIVRDAFTLRCVLLPATKIFTMDDESAKVYIQDKFKKLEGKLQDLPYRIKTLPV